MLKATTSGGEGPAPGDEVMDQVLAALEDISRSTTQVRVHERLLQAAGVRLDRAGSALLHKLSRGGGPLRVTDLAELLGVDAPTVTRKVQQLERAGLVVRTTDPGDRRATRIALTAAGRRSLDKVLQARREWLDQLLVGWEGADLRTFAILLGRFSAVLGQDMDDHRG